MFGIRKPGAKPLLVPKKRKGVDEVLTVLA